MTILDDGRLNILVIKLGSMMLVAPIVSASKTTVVRTVSVQDIALPHR